MILPVHPAPGPASTPPSLILGLAALGVRGAMYRRPDDASRPSTTPEITPPLPPRSGA